MSDNRSTQVDKPRLVDIHKPRQRIPNIQNEMEPFIQDCDYIFGLGDDTVTPSHRRTRLSGSCGTTRPIRSPGSSRA
jgi:hypothetical protein